MCITRANGRLSGRFSKGILWVSSHDSRQVEGTFRPLATVGFVLLPPNLAIRTPARPHLPGRNHWEQLGEEQGLQIVQEALAGGSGPPMARCILDEQPLPLGFRGAVCERAEGQPGTSLEIPLVEALDQP